MARPKKYESPAVKQRAYRERKSRELRNTEALQNEDKTAAQMKNPPLRYYGGKWRIASWIIQYFPPHQAFVEPFCGAANILFQKAPSPFEVINDLNGDVVNFFDVLRSRSDELIRAIQLTPFSREEHRRAHLPADDSLERARRFYIRSRQSYGSGEGEYNTGWRFQAGSARGARVIEEWNRTDHLWEAARRLKQVQIESDTAIKCIRRFDTPETLFYVDPPYMFETRHSDEERYAIEMSNEEHSQLADVLHSVKGKVILSGYWSELYQVLYADWWVTSKQSRTNGNNQKEEFLWISPAARQMSDLPLFRQE